MLGKNGPLAIILVCVLCSSDGATTYPGTWWQSGGFLWPHGGSPTSQLAYISPANTQSLPAKSQLNEALLQTSGGIHFQNNPSVETKSSSEDPPVEEVFADDAGGGADLINKLKGLTDPPVGPPPSKSKAGRFSHGAVAVDSIPCAPVGKEFLLKGGTAVDAALAVLFCNGVVTSQSMGIGGGFLMTVFLANGTKVSLVAREVAPAGTTTDMFANKSSTFGPLSSAVPGEIMGYWEAKQRFGNPEITWSELVQPAIKLCEEGIPVSFHLDTQLKSKEEFIRADPGLRDVFINKKENRPHRLGELYKHPKLAETLRRIAKGGVKEFYEGVTANLLVNDIQSNGGIMTLEDMKNYKVSWEQPIESDIPNSNYRLISAPPPGSGSIVAAILGIAGQYDPKPVDKNRPITWHRFLEACKFGFAKRTILGDWNHKSIQDEVVATVNELTSSVWQSEIQSNISDIFTSHDADHYGARFYNVEDHGTAHINVLSPKGDAVSVTSTVNTAFASKFMSPSTGILLNNQMDDFSYPNIINTFGVPPSINNYVYPGKRPVSSMSPSIVVDKNNRVVALVGSSGGTKIITAVAQVLFRLLYLNQDVKEAVDARRLHNQLYPDETKYELGTTKWLVDGLQEFDHNLVRFPLGGSSIQAIMIDQATGEITANADFRKKGTVDGF